MSNFLMIGVFYIQSFLCLVSYMHNFLFTLNLTNVQRWFRLIC